nr:hypothetical protein [uncultured Mediterranean phage uvMED]
MKKHWNTGNKYAAKDKTLDASLAFRCSQNERDFVVKMANGKRSIGTVMRELIASAMADSELNDKR